jgi:AcrR family transcriptional regulator
VGADGGAGYALELPRWSDRDAVAGLQDRARATRRALLLAAARHFADHGYHATTLRELLATSGHTKGALYFHFTSKYELAEALATELFASWEDVVARIVARGLDPLQTLLVCYDAFIGRLLQDPLAQGGHRVFQDEPGLQDARRRWNTCWEATVRDLLARAGEDGILREGIDPGRVSTLVFSTALGQFELSLVHPEGPDLWDRMNDVWLALLPAVATDQWVERWRTSGWHDRPRPDPEDYRRAREA